MQGNYNGKSVFRHRYVGMKEEAIREEIDRLQGELYAMQEALDFLYDDSREIKDSIVKNQEDNKSSLKNLSEKIDELKGTFDYDHTLKGKIESETDKKVKVIREEYKHEIGKISRLIYVNTILLVVVIFLVGFSLFHF